jgi:transglutaminase-like putative cysteine protease
MLVEHLTTAAEEVRPSMDRRQVDFEKLKDGKLSMRIRVGSEIIYRCFQPTPMILMVQVHSSRAEDIVASDLTTDPVVPVHSYCDKFGNWCSRIIAPPGDIRLTASAVVRDTGEPDLMECNAEQCDVADLPEDTLLFLLGSRYCETDSLSQAAWDLFSGFRPGWARVRAICDFVHNHIAFNYQAARSTRTALEAFNERTGVCRDYAHLAITFCRCMNIPARYCTGYLGDIGMPPPYDVMDFAAWIEVYLGGRWHMFDPRNNVPRIGRILMARGRDATDVAIATTFGPSALLSFRVYTDEVSENITVGALVGAT